MAEGSGDAKLAPPPLPTLRSEGETDLGDKREAVAARGRSDSALIPSLCASS